MIRLAVILIQIFCYRSVFPQQLSTELGLPKGHDPTKVQFLSLNNFFFLSYQTPFVTKNNRDGFKKFTAYLIGKKGEVRRINSDFFEDKIICGAVEADQQILFYYLQEDRKNILLKGANLNLESNEVTPLEKTITVPGNFIGGNVRDDRFFIYAFEKNNFLIKIVEVELLDMKSEKQFKLPINLSKFKAREIAFIPEQIQVGSIQATAKVKVMPQGNKIRIVVDDPFKEHEERAHLYKTTAIEIDYETGQSIIKVFTEETPYQFRSTIYKGHLFRTVNTFNQLKLQIYNLNSGSEVFRQLLPRDNSTKEVGVIFRENSTNHFSGETRLYDMISGSDLSLPFLLVDENEGDGKLFLTWGTYWERNTLGPVGPSLVGMMVGIAGTAIYSSMDGPGITHHFDLEGTIESGFKIIQGVNDFPVRRKIDAFEMQQNVNRVKYRRKGYFQHGNSTVALYYLPALNKLSLMEFN
jgi:hypothetical protein